MDYEFFKRIASGIEKETLTIELKSFKKILDANGSLISDSRKDIAYEIIALANTRGGKLIFGINDNGIFDGKISNIDKIKEAIHQICYDLISPIISCTTDFFEFPNEDFVIINIPKKTGLPYAVTPNKKVGEINSRIYYARTSHGKKLVSDRQLEWLFKNNESPDFKYKFRLAIEFNNTLGVVGSYSTIENSLVNSFFTFLKGNDLLSLFKDGNKMSLLMSELYPYLILKSILPYYSSSWYIKISEAFGRKSSGPFNSPGTLSKTVSISEIEMDGDFFIKTLSWNFEEVLKQNFKEKIHLPLNTEITIKKEERHSCLEFTNPEFNFKIYISTLSSGAGLHDLNPDYKVWLEKDFNNAYNFSRSNFYHFDGAGEFIANFKFPEEDNGDFDKYFQYSQTLQNLIQANWDYNKILEDLPSKEILLINSKLDDVIHMLEKKNNI
jgi:hypothetical protein